MSYLSFEEFQKYLRQMRESPYLTVDTEGTLNHPFSTTWGVSTSTYGVSEYFGFNHKIGDNLPQEWLPLLKEVIENHPCLIMHHAKHDLRSLSSLGIYYLGKFYCTMLMQHMVNENLPSKELDYVSRHHGGDPKKRSDEMQGIIKAFGWDHIPVDYMRSYGGNDAYITEELFHKLLPDFQVQQLDGELWEWEQKFVRLLMKIENTGILIDQHLSNRELDRGLKIMANLQKELGFNPASTTQLGKFFLEELNLPVVKKTPKGKPCFDKFAMAVYDELLQRSNDKRAEMILTYRGWQKTTSSNYKPYLTLLSQDGRIRPNFKMHGTVTGRLSCEHPNLQQIPRTSSKDWNGKLKRAFIVPEGYTAWEIDYSQLEFRLGAAYAKELKLIEIFNDESRDIFTEMSKELGFTRDDTKTLNYTTQYGGGANRISQVFGVSPLAAKAIIENYYSKYPGLAKFSTLAEYRAKQNGFIKLWTGRRRHFQFSDEYRKAGNSAIQGGAFEIVKRQMIRADEAGLNNEECSMDLQVHDSARFAIQNGKEQEYLPEIKRVFEAVEPDFGVKFRVGIKKWGE